MELKYISSFIPIKPLEAVIVSYQLLVFMRGGAGITIVLVVIVLVVVIPVPIPPLLKLDMLVHPQPVPLL